MQINFGKLAYSVFFNPPIPLIVVSMPFSEKLNEHHNELIYHLLVVTLHAGCLNHRWLMRPLAPAENPPRSCSCARMRPLGNHGAMFV